MATPPPPASKQLPSQENLLLNYVHRLEKQKAGRRVLHIHLSQLRPFNRRETHLRTAASNFEPLVKGMIGQLFTLKNGDLFFVFKAEAQPQLETIVQKIRFLFSEDPLVVEEESGQRAFASWYDAETQFDEIIEVARSFADAEQKRASEGSKTRLDARAALKARQEMGEPLTPEVLSRIEQALQRADLSNLVRRQFVCGIDSKMTPEQEFSELFISIKDLRETLLPGVNLLSNRWLFQHLTETLDKRMLSMLSKTDRITISGEISFNINVKTLLAPEFLTFDDNIAAARRGNMIIELQKEDIFADLGTFLFAREFVQHKGYRVLLDGLTFQTMDIIDRGRLGADLVKLIWHSEMADGGDAAQSRVRAMVQRTGPDRVVLCRCDNRESIDFGRAVGIQRFQGRFVENLIAEDGRRRDLLRLKRRIERSQEPSTE